MEYVRKFPLKYTKTTANKQSIHTCDKCKYSLTQTQDYTDSINLEAEYISGGAGPILLQILPAANSSPNFGELIGLDCIWYSVENHIRESLLIWPNPATDVLNFTTAPDAVTLLDLSGKTIIEHPGKTRQLSVEQVPSGIYIVQARYGDVWKTARVAK